MEYPTNYHLMFQKPTPPEAGRAIEPVLDWGLRAAPGQAVEGRTRTYAPDVRVAEYIALYALSTWVYTAVARLAEAVASAALEVVQRDDLVTAEEDHGLVRLLGKYGKPNDDQDSLEFFELHQTYYELCGNSFWFWENNGLLDGRPTAVHILHPQMIRIVPGVTEHVAYYEYGVLGNFFRLDPAQVTHFRKPNPFNHYWGVPALEALMVTVVGDRAASVWNRDFFGNGVAIPAGILIVPPTLTDAERDRFDREFNAKHGETRRTAILRADVGATVYHPAGLGPHDADFKEGRLLSRQEVYEALDLPLGVMSEASTEAHARVAERRLMVSVRRRHERIERKLNSDAMQFWPRWKTLSARFEDVRHDAIDWDQQSKKIKVLERYLDEEEIRRDAGYKPRKHSEHVQLPASNGRTPAAGGHSGSLQREGQAGDVLE